MPVHKRFHSQFYTKERQTDIVKIDGVRKVNNITLTNTVEFRNSGTRKKPVSFLQLRDESLAAGRLNSIERIGNTLKMNVTCEDSTYGTLCDKDYTFTAEACHDSDESKLSVALDKLVSDTTKDIQRSKGLPVEEKKSFNPFEDAFDNLKAKFMLGKIAKEEPTGPKTEPVGMHKAASVVPDKIDENYTKTDNGMDTQFQ